MGKLLLIEYPPCGTCRMARNFLKDHGIPFESRHIVEQRPTKEELRKWIKLSGLDIMKFFNSSGTKYKELGLKDKVKTASEDEMLDWLASDGMLVKRPIATDGERLTLGYNEELYERWTAR